MKAKRPRIPRRKIAWVCYEQYDNSVMDIRQITAYLKVYFKDGDVAVFSAEPVSRKRLTSCGTAARALALTAARFDKMGALLDKVGLKDRQDRLLKKMLQFVAICEGRRLVEFHENLIRVRCKCKARLDWKGGKA